MDPISNVDRLVLLLRQRMAERSKASGARAEPRDPGAGPPAAGAAEGVHALAAIEGLDDRQLKRALIQVLLAEQFGSGLINDASFQDLVDRVCSTLELDEAGAALLSRVVGELRDSAR